MGRVFSSSDLPSLPPALAARNAGFHRYFSKCDSPLYEDTWIPDFPSIVNTSYKLHLLSRADETQREFW